MTTTHPSSGPLDNQSVKLPRTLRLTLASEAAILSTALRHLLAAVGGAAAVRTKLRSLAVPNSSRDLVRKVDRPTAVHRWCTSSSPSQLPLGPKIGRAHVSTPVTWTARMPSSA